jgi:hypothetical protein
LIVCAIADASPPSFIYYLIVLCQSSSQHVADILPTCQQVTCSPKISGTPADIFLFHVADMSGPHVGPTCW